MNKDLIYKDESYKLIGVCFEVHKQLGSGLLEAIYKDAIEVELKKNNIPYEKEKGFIIKYKDVILEHKYFADFVVYDKIILEIKACAALNEVHISQTLNYLKISDYKLGLLINFGELSLSHKRILNINSSK